MASVGHWALGGQLPAQSRTSRAEGALARRRPPTCSGYLGGWGWKSAWLGSCFGAMCNLAKCGVLRWSGPKSAMGDGVMKGVQGGTEFITAMPRRCRPGPLSSGGCLRPQHTPPTSKPNSPKPQFSLQPPQQESTQPGDLGLPLGGELYPRLSSGGGGVSQV